MENETNEDILALIDLGVASVETKGPVGGQSDVLAQGSRIALDD